ncbi:MAG: hypothetical protein AAGP08_13205, partial [Pseudomonadota bacterium]
RPRHPLFIHHPKPLPARQITAVDTVTETSWRLRTACAGEGETWREVFELTLIDLAGGQRLRMMDEQGVSWTLAPC